MVYNVLNKLKWTGKLGDCKVVILHRGAPKNEKLILGKDITEIKKSHFLYREEGIQKKGEHTRREEGPQGGKALEEETYIPMHRVLRVMMGEKTLWERKH